VDLTYVQAAVIGLLQGVTELFPISSLGHSVLVPAWLGGDWSHLVTEYSTAESSKSPYLAFIVSLHVATALALMWFYYFAPRVSNQRERRLGRSPATQDISRTPSS
jgi:undecaprenyl-diphosphatase